MINLQPEIINSIENNLRLHHELYPQIPVRAEYWEANASKSLNVENWIVNNHNPNEDFQTNIDGLLKPSLKAGIIEGTTLNFSSHRMSKYSELKDMVNFLDTRDYDSYLFLSRKESASCKYHYLVGYMSSKKWKYSDLTWTPTIGTKGKSKGTQQGWRGEGLDGKVKVKIQFKMSNQLWVDIDMSLITIIKEIFI
jgi:hypothetical protein